MSKIPEKQTKRRAEILSKVIELLKTKPFEDITVQDICQTSGISVGSFYHYFKQKSDLLVGLMGLIDLYMVEQVFPKLTSDRAYTNLLVLSQGFASYVAESGIELSKLISTSDPTAYSLGAEARPLYDKLVALITSGQQQGEFSQNLSPTNTADLLLIALSGIAVDWSRRGGTYSITERMAEFTSLFFPALLKPQAVD